jgi:hypothetical protein
VGFLKEWTVTPCGLSAVMTLRITPSLPAVSMPCRTTSIARLLLAQNFICSSSIAARFLASRSSPWGFVSPPSSSVRQSASETFVPGLTR